MGDTLRMSGDCLDDQLVREDLVVKISFAALSLPLCCHRGRREVVHIAGSCFSREEYLVDRKTYQD